MGNLQALGRGYAVLGTVVAQATAAAERVAVAGTAVAARDFATSEAEFAAAEILLNEARSEFDGALAASQATLKWLDVTGTVRSGDALLTAGKAVVAAGQHISRGMGPLLTAQVFVDEEQETPALTLVEALTIAREEFRAADTELAVAEAALAGVRLAALPSEVRGDVEALMAGVPRVREPLTLFTEQSELLLAVLGSERARQYLLLFENNHEMRPTGGFIGSIAVVNIDRGVVESIDVQTVYDADGQLKEFIAPPEPLRRIVDRWYLRDANWFVDFAVSARKVASFFEKEGGPSVDGVLALTPEVIKELLIITGPVEVPQYNITVDADNFVALAQEQVTYEYDRELNQPKQFLADLTPLLLTRIFSSDGEATLAVLNAMGTMIHEKQLLAYFADEDEQAQLKRVGWSGGLPEEQQGLLAVNNANIGGHKSDQFIEQEIDYRSTVRDSGDVDVVVTIRRTHHGPTEALDVTYPDGEDPAYKDNVVWQRVLVPRGAELLEVAGASSAAEVPRLIDPEDDLELVPDPDLAEWQRAQELHESGTLTGEEAGYDYFANWVVTKPGATSVVLYRYRLPEHAELPGLLRPAGGYSAYVAKQPGETRTRVRVEVELPESVRIVHTVPHDGVTQESQNTLVYRGQLQSDKLVGGVFERN